VPWPGPVAPLSAIAPPAGPRPAAERGSDSELDPADITLPDIPVPDFSAPGGLLEVDATAAFSDASADYEPLRAVPDPPPAVAVE
jgi:hypothetical protein